MVRIPEAKCEVVYNGPTFTVARASVSITRRGKMKTYIAEGVSRLSPQDLPNAQLGEEIAKGRAEAALLRKLRGRKPAHKYMG